jgi:hypothetical protein
MNLESWNKDVNGDTRSGLVIVFGMLWIISDTLYITFKILDYLYQFVVGGSNSLFTKLDSILDAPKVKKIKIDKRIVGYSLDEETIEFPTLIRAIENSNNKPIYRHFINQTWELVNKE